AYGIGADLPAQQSGKVACDFGRRGNGFKLAISQVLDYATCCSDLRALIIAENEQLVLGDRSAGASAELVLLHWRTAYTSQIVFPAVGIQVGVLQELEKRAVQRIGARLERDVDHASSGAAIFGVEGVIDVTL